MAAFGSRIVSVCPVCGDFLWHATARDTKASNLVVHRGCLRAMRNNPAVALLVKERAAGDTRVQ